MQLSDVDGGRQVQVIIGILGVHHVAADIVICIGIGAQAVGQVLDHALHVAVQFNKVFPFFGQECPQGSGKIRKGSPGRFCTDCPVLQLFVDLYGLGMEVGQLGEFLSHCLQGIPQFLRPFRHILVGLRRIEDLLCGGVQVHAAVFGNQSHPFVVLCIPLELYFGIVFNVAVQETGGYRRRGSCIRILLVGPALDRVMQAVHMGVSL